MDHLRTRGQREICSDPCTNVELFFGLPSYYSTVDTDPNLAYVKLYFSSTVKRKKIVYDYELLTMVSEVGGYSGLLLGISCVDLIIRWDATIGRFYKQ